MVGGNVNKQKILTIWAKNCRKADYHVRLVYTIVTWSNFINFEGHFEERYATFKITGDANFSYFVHCPILLSSLELYGIDDCNFFQICKVFSQILQSRCKNVVAAENCWKRLLHITATNDCFTKPLQTDAAQNCCERLLQKKAAKDYCKKQLQCITAQNCNKRLPHKTNAKDCCRKLLQNIAAENYCKILLHKTAAKYCCTKLLQKIAAQNCCKRLLPTAQCQQNINF